MQIEFDDNWIENKERKRKYKKFAGTGSRSMRVEYFFFVQVSRFHHCLWIVMVSMEFDTCHDARTHTHDRNISNFWTIFVCFASSPTLHSVSLCSFAVVVFMFFFSFSFRFCYGEKCVVWISVCLDKFCCFLFVFPCESRREKKKNIFFYNKLRTA